MFTRLSQFTYGSYKIPNIDTAAINNNVELQIHIQKYEPQILRMLLGDCLFAEFMQQVEKDDDGYYRLKTSSEEAPIDAKWGWLLSGRNYPATITSDVCGCACGGDCDTHYWDGLVKKVATISEKDLYESVMAPVIYFYWLLNDRNKRTGTGEVKDRTEKSVIQTSHRERVDAWNDFVQMASVGFPGGRVALSMFLAEHVDEFPEAICANFQTMTYYDL